VSETEIGEETQISLLKRSGYSDKAIDYFINKVNVGGIEKPSASFAYTGPCGDSMEFQIRIDDGRIMEAKFQAIGCAGSYTAGSALTEMIKGKTLDEAEGITAEEVVRHLGGIPISKVHCTCLAKRTLEKAIEQYRKAIGER